MSVTFADEVGESWGSSYGEQHAVFLLHLSFPILPFWILPKDPHSSFRFTGMVSPFL